MLRVSTTVIVAALMAVSLAGAALANHPGHGGGNTTLSDLGCGLDEIARVKDADEWECNADLTLNEAAAADAQSTADQAVSDADAAQAAAVDAQAAADAAQGTAVGAATAAAAAQTDATDAQTTADQAVGAAAAAQTTATAAGNDAAAAQADADAALSALAALEARILALEEGGGGVPGGGGEKLVFVTSGAYAPLVAPDCTAPGADPLCVPSSGSFNSVADADAICQGIAVEVGLTNGAEGSPNFIAWLSSRAGVSPNARFDQDAGPYVNIAGQVIATGWTDLIDGILNIPIDLDEIGDPRDLFTGVWTGTSVTGAPTLCDCGSWVGDADNCPTDIAPFTSLAGTIGDPLASTEHWTDLSLQLEPSPPFPPEFSSCNTPHGLYCFEQ